eukprot:1159985-Pelagomonas_calceolata.AAC.1
MHLDLNFSSQHGGEGKNKGVNAGSQELIPVCMHAELVFKLSDACRSFRPSLKQLRPRRKLKKGMDLLALPVGKGRGLGPWAYNMERAAMQQVRSGSDV